MRCKVWMLGLVLIATTVFIAGCGSEPPVPTTSVSPLATPETAGTGDIVSTSMPSEQRTPLPTPAGSLTAEVIPLEGPAFSIDEPLRDGDTQVSGAGPSDIPILIADLTLTGETIGRGQIGPNGRFTIPVSPALIVNHRIGILLDTQSTEIQLSEQLLTQLDTLRGDAAISIPRIGTAYDAVSVQP